MLTPSQRRNLARHGAASVEREQAAYRKQVAADDAAADRARIDRDNIAKQAETDRVKFTRDNLTGARAIRTKSGWRAVTTINNTTVSVTTGYSWVDRIPFGKILEVLH